MESQVGRARAVAHGMALAAFFVVVSPLAQSDDPGARALDAFAYALLVVAGLSFGARGRHPYAGYAAALACTVAYLLAGYGGGPIYVAPFAGLVRVVAVSAPRVWVPIAGGGSAALALATALEEGWSPEIALTTGVWLVGALLLGEAVRARRGQEDALVARAGEVERTRAEEALRRAAEERLRLAREVHDVVGHSLAVISLQAGVAAHLLETRPEQARDAVAAIRQVSNEALDDLRAELGLLRDGHGAPPPPATADGLEGVPALVASLRQAGVAVELETSGRDEAAVSGPASAAGYRIVREALTNVARHAGAGSRARVRITRHDEAVEVEVVDDGVGPAAANGTGDGTGLAGARACRRARRPHGGRRGARRRLSRLGVAAVATTMSIRVVLADDQALVRGGLRVLIEAEADLVVVGEATDGAEAITVVRAQRPDVVLMDIRMPGVDGLEATRRIAADDALDGVRVLILTTFEIDEYVFAALRAGAGGFLLKDAEPAALLHAIRVVASGEALLSPSVTRRVVEVFAGGSTPTAPQASLLAELTEREREVVGLVAHGLSNAAIGQRLFISPATARTHVSRAMVKLGARDRAQLVVFAYESGLVAPGRPAA